MRQTLLLLSFCSFLFVIEHMMPLCMVISWVYSVAMMIQHIVAEKEQRLKEVSRLGSSAGPGLTPLLLALLVPAGAQGSVVLVNRVHQNPSDGPWFMLVWWRL